MAATFVRKHGEDNTGTSPSINLTTGVSAGNTLIYYIACDNTAGTDLPNVIDIAVGTFTQGVDYDVYFVGEHASASTSASAATRGFIIAIQAINNLTGAVVPVTASFSAAPAKMVAVLAEFSGVDPATISVAASGGTGNTNRFQSGVPADDLVLGLVSCEDNAAMTIQADWTEPGGDGAVFTTGGGAAANVSMICGYIIPPSSNTYFLNAASGFSNDGGSVAVTLAAASTAPQADADDTSHAVTSDTVALTQVHSVAVNAGNHAVTSDTVALSQNSNLVIANAAHAVTSDQVTLAVVTNLVVADASHGHTAGNVALTQAHSLTVAAGTHAHTADNVSVTQVHVLVAAAGTHAVTSDQVTLGGSGDLGIADGAHSVTSSTVALTQVHVIVVANAAHALTSDQVTVTENSGSATELVIASSSHSVTSSTVTVTITYVVVISDAAHTIDSGRVTLVRLVPVFRTPTVEDPYLDTHGQNNPWGIELDAGITVLKIDGVYHQVRWPTDDDIASASAVYRGGFENQLTDEEVADLTAAGYGAYIQLTPA